MSRHWNAAFSSQYSAALHMLGRAIDACPDPVWTAGDRFHTFSYIAYHTMFWTDFYLSGTPEGYHPPAPFNLDELDPAGITPDPPYGKPVLREYLAHLHDKLGRMLAVMDDTAAAGPHGFTSWRGTLAELHADNLRHLGHHVGQLQLLLRQAGVEPPRWLSQGRSVDTAG
jgi:hypothetical protein